MQNEAIPSLQRSKATTNLLSAVQVPKKRDLTYDDILASMNLKVQDGELQYINPVPKPSRPLQSGLQSASQSAARPLQSGLQSASQSATRPLKPEIKRVRISNENTLPGVLQNSLNEYPNVKLEPNVKLGPPTNRLPSITKEQYQKMVNQRPNKTTKLLFSSNVMDGYNPSIRSTNYFLHSFSLTRPQRPRLLVRPQGGVKIVRPGLKQ